MVTVYSIPNCVQCNSTRKVLDKHGIEYTVIDITKDENAREYVLSLGYMTAPVVVVDQEHWSGFRPDKLNSIVIL
jgi:glutaredoxin-like protein NrdH